VGFTALVLPPKLVLLNNTEMKIINSAPISSFGGLNFVLDEFERAGLGRCISSKLPGLPPQSKYSWKDIFYSFWSLFFCGGDCAEDLAGNFKTSLNANPFIKIPSPDRVLNRIKGLTEPMQLFDTVRGAKLHEFSMNNLLTGINLALVKKLGLLGKIDLTLDYDNTIIFSKKADSKMTYKKDYGYCPGVGLVGGTVVYVENRNGNSDAQTLQDETLERMFDALGSAKIKINRFRADGASYQLKTLSVACKYADKIYVRARKDQSVMKAVASVAEWEKVETRGGVEYYGSVEFTPFKKCAREHKLQHLLKPYRLVVAKTRNSDGQLDLFTGEACDYSVIITNDYEMPNLGIVQFYNQRGASEKEFDVLKNDFGWGNMPFSKLEQNTVYLIICAMCRNLYNYIIKLFSKKIACLSPGFRVKKFIFRFICIPAKWVKASRSLKLRLYGGINFQT
jgi:hypothetical protein